jgi:hypothetical protein
MVEPMPGIHFSLRLTEQETVALVERALESLAHRLGRRAFRLLGGEDARGAGGKEQEIAGTAAGDQRAMSRNEALAYLHMLVRLQAAVARLEDRAAEEAAAAGAGYPQIGKACNISRQAARRRWPGLVTHDMSRHPVRRATSTRSR